MVFRGEEIGTVIEYIEGELKQKYREMGAVLEQTKELREALNKNQKMQVKEVLRNRALALERVKECDLRILAKTEEVKVLSVSSMSHLLRGSDSGYQEEEAFRDILVLVNGTRTLWGKIIEMDSLISKRVIGKDSFYK